MEIGLDGEMAKITDTRLPQTLLQMDETEYTDIESVLLKYKEIMEDEKLQCLGSLVTFLRRLTEQEQEVEPVALDPCKDKNKRRAIHQLFRKCVFVPPLKTKALDLNKEGNQDIIVVSKQGGRVDGKNSRKTAMRKEDGPWPGGKEKKYIKFVLEKTNIDTMNAISKISKTLHLSPKILSVAGIKDKRGITSQWVTGFRVHPSNLLLLNTINGFCVGNFEYTSEELHTGDLKGNAFEIILRGVTQTQKEIHKSVDMTKKYGFINYFGLQRFGTGNTSTHVTGAAILSGEWEKAIGHILAPSSWAGQDLQNALNLYLKGGNAEDALKALPRGYGSQRTVLQALAKQDGNSCLVDGLLALPKIQRTMYIHAFQSYIWNKMVSKRIDMQDTLAVMPGDLVLSRKTMENNRGKLIGKKRNAKSLYDDDGSKDEFEEEFVEPHEVTVDDCEKKLYSPEDIVLPVPGSQVFITGYAKDFYDSILQEFDIYQASHNIKEFLLESFPGTYRHLICKPWNFEHMLGRYNQVDQDISFDDAIESGKLQSHLKMRSETFWSYQSYISNLLLFRTVIMQKDAFLQ